MTQTAIPNVSTNLAGVSGTTSTRVATSNSSGRAVPADEISGSIQNAPDSFASVMASVLNPPRPAPLVRPAASSSAVVAEGQNVRVPGADKQSSEPSSRRTSVRDEPDEIKTSNDSETPANPPPSPNLQMLGQPAGLAVFDRVETASPDPTGRPTSTVEETTRPITATVEKSLTATVRVDMLPDGGALVTDTSATGTASIQVRSEASPRQPAIASEPDTGNSDGHSDIVGQTWKSLPSELLNPGTNSGTISSVIPNSERKVVFTNPLAMDPVPVSSQTLDSTPLATTSATTTSDQPAAESTSNMKSAERPPVPGDPSAGERSQIAAAPKLLSSMPGSEMLRTVGSPRQTDAVQAQKAPANDGSPKPTTELVNVTQTTQAPETTAAALPARPQPTADSPESGVTVRATPRKNSLERSVPASDYDLPTADLPVDGSTVAEAEGRKKGEQSAIEPSVVGATAGTTGNTSKTKTAKADTSKVDTSRVDTSRVDTSRVDTSTIDTSTIDTSTIDTSTVDASTVNAADVPDNQPLTSASTPIEAARVNRNGDAEIAPNASLSGAVIELNTGSRGAATASALPRATTQESGPAAATIATVSPRSTGRRLPDQSSDHGNADSDGASPLTGGQVTPTATAEPRHFTRSIDAASAAAPFSAAAQGEDVKDQVITAIKRFEGIDGAHHISLELNPNGLGSVAVELTVEGTTVHLHMTAQHASTGELLRSALDSLRTSLTDGGFTAGSFDVGQHTNSNAQQRSPQQPMHRSNLSDNPSTTTRRSGMQRLVPHEAGRKSLVGNRQLDVQL